MWYMYADSSGNGTKFGTLLWIHLGMDNSPTIPHGGIGSGGLGGQQFKSLGNVVKRLENIKHYNMHNQTYIWWHTWETPVTLSICILFMSHNSLETFQPSLRSTSSLSLSKSSSVTLHYLSICCSTLPFHDTHQKRRMAFEQFHTCTREPSDINILIIISRTAGLMCGINRRSMGDYGMASLKLPKLCFDQCWPLKWPKNDV